MGLLKKIFKPVSKVLDKVIPNEIKPALPYLAAFAPMFGPTSGLMGDVMLRRALISGGLNIGAQLAQEGNEGEINLLSAGLGALTGAMTAPGAAETFRGAQSANVLQDANVQRTALQKATDFGLEGLAKGSEMFAAGAEKGLFSKEGLKAATLPAATATGDVMQAQARQLEKQAAIDAALAEAEALGDIGGRAAAIRNAMNAYGFFTEEEIEDTIASAGYKSGGRVGFEFGGIERAIENVTEEMDTKSKEGIMAASKEDPLLIEEYNRYVFDLLENRPSAKPMSFQEFKRMIKSGFKSGGRVKMEKGGDIKEGIMLVADETGGEADFGSKEYYEKEVAGYQRLDELAKLLKPFSDRVLKENCLDLPEKTYIERQVELTDEQKKTYETMKSAALASLKGKMATAPHVLTQLMRLHQITCGHLKNDDETITEIKNNRIDALLELLEETEGKAIIWANYVYDIKRIVKAISKKYGEDSIVQYYGAVPADVRQKNIEKFQDPKSPARFFVGNPQTGGYGITLTAANNVIYYSNGYDLEKRLQSEDRAHRIGQKKAVTYIDLITPKTVDEKIRKALRKKINIATEIMGEELREWI